MRLPLVGGAYSARSIIANCQRCVNLYPEHNGNGAPIPITHYQRPGLRPIMTGPVVAPVRNIYRASNSAGYCTIGDTVFAISPTNTLTALGNITAGKTTPVSMADNGVTVVVVDGSPNGWLIDLATNTFSPWTPLDPAGLFRGADKIQYIDGFFIMNVAPGLSTEWISTVSGTTDFDTTPPSGLNPFAFKAAYPDPLVSLIVHLHYVILFGNLKSELWFNAGQTPFPFVQFSGAYYEHGAGAKYSIASADTSVYFLGQDLQGHGVVWKIGGGNINSCRRVSNHAIEYQIRTITKNAIIDDAIGYTYQMDGHWFYALHFPSGDQTWVYDDTLGATDPDLAWHQQAWTPPGTTDLHRHRGNCYGFVNELNMVGDFENGTIYSMDPESYIDVVDQAACQINFIRTFPHLGTGEVEIGTFGKRPIMADGRRVRHTAFMLDMECGTAEGPDFVVLRYSDDRGRTYSADVLQNTGPGAAFLTQPIWRGLGIARDRVYEVQYTTEAQAALNGAWVEGEVLET